MALPFIAAFAARRKAARAAATEPDPAVRTEQPMDRPTAQRVQIVERPWAAVPVDEARILNDDSVASVFTLYRDVMLGGGWHWEGDDVEELEEYTDAVEQAHGLPQLLDEIAAAPFQRFAVAEIVWQLGGTWVPISYRVLPHIQFNATINTLGEVSSMRAITTAGVQDVPLQQAVFWAYRPTHLNPLGTSFYDSLEEVVNFKRRADAALVGFVERLSGPAVIGYYAPGTPEPEQQAMFQQLKKLRSNSVATVPGPKGGDGNMIELLEAAGMNGAIGVSVEAGATFERRIARRVLGAVLPIFESQWGTRAQASTHLDIMKSIIQTRQSEVEEPIQKQIVDRMIGWNFGPGAKDVQFKLNAPKLDNLQALASAVAELAAAGFIDPAEDGDIVRARFDFPARTVEEPTAQPAGSAAATIATRQAGNTSEPAA